MSSQYIYPSFMLFSLILCNDYRIVFIMKSSNVFSMTTNYDIELYNRRNRIQYYEAISELFKNKIINSDIASSYYDTTRYDNTIFIFKKESSHRKLIGMLNLSVIDSSDSDLDKYEVTLRINDFFISSDHTQYLELAEALYKPIELEIKNEYNRMKCRYYKYPLNKKIIMPDLLQSYALKMILKDHNSDINFEFAFTEMRINKNDLIFAMSFARMNGDHMIGIENYSNPVYITYDNHAITREGTIQPIDNMSLQMRPWWYFKKYISEQELDEYENQIKNNKTFEPYINNTIEVNLEDCLKADIFRSPFEINIWVSKDKHKPVKLDIETIDKILKDEKFKEDKVKYLSAIEWSSLSHKRAYTYHHKRVAMIIRKMEQGDKMAQHPVRVSANEYNHYIDIKLEDGRHRLAAMIYMNQKTISIQCSKDQESALKEKLEYIVQSLKKKDNKICLDI